MDDLSDKPLTKNQKKKIKKKQKKDDLKNDKVKEDAIFDEFINLNKTEKNNVNTSINIKECTCEIHENNLKLVSRFSDNTDIRLLNSWRDIDEDLKLRGFNFTQTSPPTIPVR